MTLWPKRVTQCAFTTAVALALGVGVPLVRAQTGGIGGPPVHMAEFGAYTLRANAIPSNELSAAMAKLHGIERADDRGVLNLVVQQRQPDGRLLTVPAAVTARQENLLGQNEEIEMREVKENNRVSYLGAFGFSPLRNFRFTLNVRPAGSDETLTTTFEDRFRPHPR